MKEIRRLLIVFCLVTTFVEAQHAYAKMPSDPAHDPTFTTLPSGKDLREIKVKGSSLSLSRGSGGAFSETKQKAYEKIKLETQSNPASKTQWVLMDLGSRQIIDQSANSWRKIFGASTSKIFVGATLLDKQNTELSNQQLQLMSDMLVVSSNKAWVELQRQIGEGNSDRGRETIQRFTQRMGYERTRAFQGTWNGMHGNELAADELAEFLYDTYQGRYPGAETLWKLMYTCRTGASRGRKYVPKDIFVGGKTGTYAGPSVDPETGVATRVDVTNHALIFNIGGRQYGLAVLSNAGVDENVALLAGGLIREYAKPESEPSSN